jgi:ARG/rhodanese/phosphatase superfamily protein
MQRSFFGVLISSITIIATLGGLSFMSAAPSSHKAPSAPPEGDWRILDAITYENISLFPVVGGSQDTSSFLTLEEGLASGEVLVTEQGAERLIRDRGQVRPIAVPQYNASASVNQLVLINRSKRPLLLLAGELVSGGKQDRIIGKDRIVPVGAEPLPLDVFCVEHGRWTGSSSQFVASKSIVHPSVREQAAVNQEQTKVWAAVAGGTTETVTVGSAAPAALPTLSRNVLAETIATEAQTQSYEKIYDSRRVGVSVDALVDELQKRFARGTAGLKGERVVGVIVAYGGEVAWSDIFASSDLFHHYWSKLLRSYAVEALARPTLRETASVDDAREFLRRPKGREMQETEAGVYRWREVSEGKLALIELEALQPKPMILHRLLLHRTS